MDQEQLRTHLNERHCEDFRCCHCKEEFIDNTQLEAHYTETRHPRSPDMRETPDDDLPDFEEVKRNSEVCSNCGAEGGRCRTPCTLKICRNCLTTKHFSKKCDNFRPRQDCFRCGEFNYALRGCPVGPAIGARAMARAAFSDAFPQSRNSYEEIVATDEVDEKSLVELDKGLARKLEFKCSIPLAVLKD